MEGRVGNTIPGEQIDRAMAKDSIIEQVIRLYKAERGASSMSKLERYAMVAMQGIMSNDFQLTNKTNIMVLLKNIAIISFDAAEAMIAEEERRNK